MRAYRCVQTLSTTTTPVSVTGGLTKEGADCSDVASGATRHRCDVFGFRHRAEHGRFVTLLASRETGLCQAMACNVKMTYNAL